MWNVLVAVRMWGHQWSSGSFNIKCDNEAVVSVVNTDATRDYVLGTMARNIWLETASRDIKLKLNHIAGKDNGCADLLSRWHLINNRDRILANFINTPIWCKVSADHLCLNLEISYKQHGYT